MADRPAYSPAMNFWTLRTVQRAYTAFSAGVWIASNSRRKDSATGEWVDKPNFFDVAVFGAQAETVARFTFKGRPIALEGRLDWHEWETKDGRKAQDVSIIADNVQFIGDPARTGGAVDADDGMSVTDADGELDETDVAAMAALSDESQGAAAA